MMSEWGSKMGEEEAVTRITSWMKALLKYTQTLLASQVVVVIYIYIWWDPYNKYI